MMVGLGNIEIAIEIEIDCDTDPDPGFDADFDCDFNRFGCLMKASTLNPKP